jgi:hypothetical protein
MSTKVQSYVEALLRNPEFIKVAAKRYGEVQTAGESGLVCNLSPTQLATAIHDVEEALLKFEPFQKLRRKRPITTSWA